MATRTLVVDGLRLLGSRTAVGRHVEYLAQWWSNNDIPFDQVVIAVPGLVTLDGLGSTTPVEVRVCAPWLPNLAWQQVALPAVARRAAVLFCEYTCPVVAPTPPIVLANHGIYEALPHTFSRSQRFRATAANRASARRARRVIANSTNTKADLVRYFGIDAADIEIVLPAPAAIFGREHDAEAVASERAAILHDDLPFVLFVGKFSHRRHVPRLVEAFVRARPRLSSSYRLVLVGPDITDVDPVALAARLGAPASVVHIDHLEQERLALLYSAADLFVLPSEYEGLSWTMLEAMASGTAVLTVDHPTVAEAAGRTVATIGEPTIEALCDSMVELLNDDARRQELARQARRQVERFSPDAMARSTTDMLDRVARCHDRERLGSRVRSWRS